MAQGDFTKEEAKETAEAFSEVFKALSKTKQAEFLGHANDIYLFLTACERNYPGENDIPEPTSEPEPDAQPDEPTSDPAHTV